MIEVATEISKISFRHAFVFGSIEKKYLLIHLFGSSLEEISKFPTIFCLTSRRNSIANK